MLSAPTVSVFRNAFVPPRCTGGNTSHYDAQLVFDVALSNETLVVRAAPMHGACPTLRVTLDRLDANDVLGYYGGPCWFVVDSNATAAARATVTATDGAHGHVTVSKTAGLLPARPTIRLSGRAARVGRTSRCFAFFDWFCRFGFIRRHQLCQDGLARAFRRGVVPPALPTLLLQQVSELFNLLAFFELSLLLNLMWLLDLPSIFPFELVHLSPKGRYSEQK